MQELDGLTEVEKRELKQNAYVNAQEKKAGKHLVDAVKHYFKAIGNVGMAIHEGIAKPLTKRAWEGTKRMPKKIGKKIKGWFKGLFRAKGDAVQYVEKVNDNDTQVPQSNPKVQELDGLTEDEKRKVIWNAYSELQEEKAGKHLLDAVKHYAQATGNVGMAMHKGIIKPVGKGVWEGTKTVGKGVWEGTKRMPKKIGKKIKGWFKGLFDD